MLAVAGWLAGWLANGSQKGDKSTKKSLLEAQEAISKAGLEGACSGDRSRPKAAYGAKL